MKTGKNIRYRLNSLYYWLQYNNCDEYLRDNYSEFLYFDMLYGNMRNIFARNIINENIVLDAVHYILRNEYRTGKYFY